MSSLRLLAILITTLLIQTGMMACRSSSASETATPKATQLTGQQLAQAHCSSCHQFPDPSLLDKATWQQGVLPNMAVRLGVSTEQMAFYSTIADPAEQQRVIASGLFPTTPVIHPSDWQKIVAYYQTEAPDTPRPQPAHRPVQAELPLFLVQTPTGTLNGMVTLLQYDSLSHRIWAGDRSGHLYAFNDRLERLDTVRVGSPPVGLRTNRDGSLDLLAIGLMDPNDQQTGEWLHLPNPRQPATSRIQTLQRPVHAAFADLNRDGREDVVICQFGHYLGQLTWHEQLSSGYKAHVIEAVPGARQTIIRDVDGDQWPDIVALLTQGDEQVAVFYNLRNGFFRKETVLRFPPIYGSSYVTLSDVDRDGDEDLVYTNGDNADYSIVPKAYHGVRIFLNNGQFRFKQAWFYPMHGASQVIARDFDQDGDIDLAAIAYFPDFTQQPNQGFVYFENEGKLSFRPRTFANAGRGRWLTMDAGDVDQDGDEDILLGSYFQPVNPKYRDMMENWRKPGTGITLLRNSLRKSIAGGKQHLNTAFR
ncbi:hypothetical protein BN8_00223 [Fibrisoma limi BUZ 3]|uniref:Cytochrome c domain-containing protein n=1 Tax=Fibrisoma limi BUZ 3 TaxID=1185876 RepID=I2GBN2_9BACT|nr:VCBS repeat-containing protein [Fibrisoma limi]CCH51306.1 hypothetical protein BN8_00223 [Fibrisoma limi BUZ 3]